MVSNFLVQLWIFWQLCLINLLWPLIGLGLLYLWHFIYARVSTWFGMLVFFKVKSYTISSGLFGLVMSFLSEQELRKVLMRGLCKNTQLMPVFPKTPFLVLPFFKYTLITFLMMLLAKLLSMLMIQLFILNTVKHLICGNN